MEYGVLVLERLPYWFVLIAMLIDALSPRSQLLSVTPLVKREVLVKVPVVSSATYRTKSHLTLLSSVHTTRTKRPPLINPFKLPVDIELVDT